ncbi:hypothetical protein, partial [Acinetobacter baumannii]|uniref:hypothetical protein n=1 Tax=Acinetobacter baumannii TaxID=470 RepID=UPI0033919B2E
MQLAIERVKNGESARSVAKDTGLAHNTLSRRIKQQQYALPTAAKNQKLSPVAEEEVYDWIVAEEAGGRAPTA